MPPVHTHLTLEFASTKDRDTFYDTSRGLRMEVLDNFHKPRGFFSVIRLKNPLIRYREQALNCFYRTLEDHEIFEIDPSNTDRNKFPRIQARHYPDRQADDGTGYSSFFLVDESDSLTLLCDVYWRTGRDCCRLTELSIAPYLHKPQHRSLCDDLEALMPAHRDDANEENMD